jgi:hypothetical protein
MFSSALSCRLAGCVVAAALLAPPAYAQSGYGYWVQPAVPWAGQGCGYGAYRAPNGSCDVVKDPNWQCQPGLHNVPTPVANGYRCVLDGY